MVAHHRRISASIKHYPSRTKPALPAPVSIRQAGEEYIKHYLTSL